jgi:hypothetical protein
MRCLRVDVVDADVLVLDEYFTLLRFRHWNIGLVLQDICSASLFDQDGLHGLWKI